MDNITLLQNTIKDSGYLYFWYIAQNDIIYKKKEPILIVAGMTEEETLKRVEELGLKEDTQLYRLNIELYSEELFKKKASLASRIAILIKTFIIKNSKVIFDNTWKEKANAYIWFHNNNTIKKSFKWKYYYIKNIVDKIDMGYLKIEFGITYYSNIR